MTMSGIKNAWDKERLRYQKRYADYAKKYQEQEENAELRGHLQECSHVLIRVFGLTPRQLDELEKYQYCGLTSSDLDKE